MSGPRVRLRASGAVLPPGVAGRARAAVLAVLAGMAVLAGGLGPAAGARAAGSEDAAGYVEFVREDAANCVIRNGVRVMVRSTHPSRTVRVWLDRYLMGSGTGDRSRTDLKPGAEPEPLGCSKSNNAEQEWRIVRAQFVD